MELRIWADLVNAVHDIFLKYQQEYEIKSGDIDPITEYDLQEAQMALANKITEVLERQRWYYGRVEVEDEDI